MKQRLLQVEKEMLLRVERCGAVSRNEMTDHDAAVLRELARKNLVEGYSANKTTWWRLKPK